MDFISLQSLVASGTVVLQPGSLLQRWQEQKGLAGGVGIPKRLVGHKVRENQ